MTTILPETPPVLVDTGIYFNGDPLGEPAICESGRISLGHGLFFEDLAALDAVIGHLSEARYKVASIQLAAESAHQDSTPKDRMVALAERHYAHPELVNMGRGLDEREADYEDRAGRR